MSREVKVQFLDAGSAVAFRRLYDDVLQPSFAAAELLEADTLWQDVCGGRVLVAAAVEGDDVCGAIVADWYQQSRVLLISYLAVRPGRRAEGIGGRLITTAVARWRDLLAPLAVVAEVEDPRYFLDDRYGDAGRRLTFYDRLGARFLPVPYMQPEVRPGHGRVPHLLLMVIAWDESACVAPGRLDGALIDRFLGQSFEQMEGRLTPGDIELARLRDACRRPDGLPLLDAAQAIGAKPIDR